MHTIQFKINDEYKQIIISLLKSLKSGIIKDLKIVDDNKQEPESREHKDIFSKTSGLLKSQNIDPIQWQNQIRNEWDK